MKEQEQEKLDGNVNMNTDGNTLEEKIINFINNQMIRPDNPRLINFRILVTFAWILDYGLTTFLMSNYWFQRGDADYSNFLYHKELFYYVMII